MPRLTKKLLKAVSDDFQSIRFVTGETCLWSSEKKEITYNPTDKYVTWDLLHECAHAALNHNDFEKDIQLLMIETAAWDYASTVLGPKYDLSVPDDYQQAALESYRVWLHTRSSCPECGQTGIQTKTNSYSCVNCSCLWQVNDARQCALRRTVVSRQQDQVDL